MVWDAQGGWYEGEWCAGEREGAGARLMRNGAVKAGRWRKGGLERQLEPRECAIAVRTAQKAAAAARRCALNAQKGHLCKREAGNKVVFDGSMGGAQTECGT